MPVGVNVALLVLAATAFYTYIGQLVPQKRVLPPETIELTEDISTQEMVRIGQEIAEGKGLCLTCHTIGQSGALRFPDLSGVGSRASEQVEGMTDLDYLAQSLYEPNAYVVPGFNPAMPPIHKPPIGLSDEEILAVIAWLQSLGAEPTVTMQTTHRYRQSAGG